MKNKRTIKILIAVMVLVLGFGAFAGCGTETASAGTLVLKVNPEFEINYDEDGNVVSIMPVNDDAGKLMDKLSEYEGKPTDEIVSQLIALMEKEGFIIKADAAGMGNDINIQIKEGSKMPDDDFLDNIVKNVKAVFDGKNVMGKVVISGESNYGIKEYSVSDYGDTNYKAAKTKIDSAVQSGNSYTNYSNTDYDGYNSNYGAATDYDGNNTNYNGSSGNSNYGGSSSSSGNSNYGGSSGSSGNSNYGGGSSSSSGNSNYDDSSSSSGNSNYGNSSYDDNDSDSGNSNYDD